MQEWWWWLRPGFLKLKWCYVLNRRWNKLEWLQDKLTNHHCITGWHFKIGQWEAFYVIIDQSEALTVSCERSRHCQWMIMTTMRSYYNVHCVMLTLRERTAWQKLFALRQAREKKKRTANFLLATKQITLASSENCRHGDLHTCSYQAYRTECKHFASSWMHAFIT